MVITKGVDVRTGMRKLGDSIEAIPSKPVQDALKALLTSAQGDAVYFRHSVEQWYDDQMERVSGWYRRRIQKVLWILAFAVVIALNADTLQIAKRLWVDPTQRAAIVSQAQNATSSSREQPVKELRSFPSLWAGTWRACATIRKASRSTSNRAWPGRCSRS